MAAKRQKPIFLLATLSLIVVTCVGAVAGFYVIRRSVIEQFGPPDQDMNLIQNLVYPIELYINRETLTRQKGVMGTEQDFEVAQGESVSLVCLRLEREGLIDDAELFRIYLVYSGLDRHLQSGRFKLNSAMSATQIASELLDATPKDAIVTILPGWRIEEIAVNIARSGLSITADEFIEAAYNPSPEILAYLSLGELPSLEGFLFPGTYIFPRESGLDVVFKEILLTFNAELGPELKDGFSRQGLSVYDAVILASIVEKESVVADEKPMIASVFYNRLTLGMRLETDPTVQYALGYQLENGSWWKSPLFTGDLQVESPYNTYKVFGLPPTPICSPDLGSLRAVAFPAETPYYYFRAACDDSGRHNFAITFEEHLNNSCE